MPWRDAVDFLESITKIVTARKTAFTANLVYVGAVTPVTITNSGAQRATVMVFDGADLTETNIVPMCDFVEIR